MQNIKFKLVALSLLILSTIFVGGINAKASDTRNSDVFRMTASPQRISRGGSSDISWNANLNSSSSCRGRGGTNGWEGTKNISGTFHATNITETTTFYIMCTGDNREYKHSASVTVTVNTSNDNGDDENNDDEENDNDGPKPTVTLTVDDSSLDEGDSTTIRWTSNRAVFCNGFNGTNGWRGSRGLSGSFNTGNIGTTTTFGIICGSEQEDESDTDFNDDDDDETVRKVTVNVNDDNGNGDDGDVTILNFSADDTSIPYGTYTILRWSSDNADSCSGTGGTNSWSGSKNRSGTFNTGNLTSDKTYTLTCENNSDSESKTVTVRVENQTSIPSVDLTVDDASLNEGDSTTIRWSTNDADSCSATGGSNGWSGSKGLSGSFNTGSLYNTLTYTLRCTNVDGDQRSDSITIYVDDSNNNNDDERPTVSTRDADNVDEESATLNGFVDANGGSGVKAWFEWGTNSGNYSENTSRINYGSTNGTNFDYTIDGLDTDETYYFRAVAENSNGERVYGSQKSFTTDDNNNNSDTPNVTTYSAQNVDENSAILRGYVDTNGESVRKWFEWGERSGSLNEETDKSSRSSSSRSFEDSIDDLEPDTVYYYRAVAEDDDGDIDYGRVMSFRTEDENGSSRNCTRNCAPSSVSTLASNVGNTSARLNGISFSNGSSYVTGYFEWGVTPSLGIRTPSTNIGSGTAVPFYQSLFGLTPGTIYYYRAVATNEYGTARGDITSFRTLSGGGSSSTTRTTTVVTNTNTTNTNNTNTSNTNTSVNGEVAGASSSRPSLVFLSVEESEGRDTVKIGDEVEYRIEYRNISSENLGDVVLRISLPKELKFIDTTRGYLSDENNIVVVNIGSLDPEENGSVVVTTEITDKAEAGRIFVVTANLAYTIESNDTQEEVFAYAKNTVDEGDVLGLGGLALFGGNGFLPNSLLAWLLLILLIVLIIIAARKAYAGERNLVVVAGDKSKEETTQH